MISRNFCLITAVRFFRACQKSEFEVKFENIISSQQSHWNLLKKPKTLENKGFRRCLLASLRGFEPPAYRLGELCGSVNPRQELICLAFYYQGLFLFSNQILVI